MDCQSRALDTKNRVERSMEKTWEPQLASKKLELFSNKYYAACAFSGMIPTGSVHLPVTPFDMLKVNMQANPGKYTSILSSFGIVYSEQGLKGVWKGWIIADAALCPFESIKVRVQRGYAKGLHDGLPRLYRSEGLAGLYKGLLPLWGRNLPFAMLMFATFEHSVDFVYGNIIHQPKSECSTGVQLRVTCVAGYMSGVTGTVISNPADNMITVINNRKGLSYMQAAKSIGVVWLFTRSLPLRMMLVGPLVTAQWFCYDTIKVLVGLPTSGGVEQLIQDQD